MKKFLIAQLIFIVLAGAFVLAIDNPDQPGFQSVAAVLFWTFIILLWMAVFSATSNMIKAENKKGDHASSVRDDAIANIRRHVEENPEHGLVRKTFSWVQSIIIVCLAAYTGMVVAAPLYLVAAFIAKTTTSSFRAALEKIDGKGAAPAAT